MMRKLICFFFGKMFIITALSLLIFFTQSIKGFTYDNVYTTHKFGQLVTSSTLRWRSATSKNPSEYRDDPLVLEYDGRNICRGYHQSQLVPGSTGEDGKCLVGFFDKLYSLEKFYVMIDKTGTSRLEWKPWDVFTKLPLSMVAYNQETYVARVKNSDGQYVLGALNPRHGLSGDIAVYLTGKVDYFTQGEILTETEPVGYQLEDIRFIQWRAKVHKEAVFLGTQTLMNEGEDWKKVKAMLAFNATYSFYWGQLHGLIKALPSVARESYNGTVRHMEFSWGLPLKYQRHRVMEVVRNLRPGTAVKVMASATRTTTELPYSAKLISIFTDGKKPKQRKLEATYLETLLKNIHLEVSEPYFITNGSLAPTTTTTTTTKSTIITITMTTTTTTVKTTTLRPKRTTTPLPTSPNPLLRFYPMDDHNDIEELSINGTMMSDQAQMRRNMKPMTESLKNFSTTISPFFSLLIIILISVALS